MRRIEARAVSDADGCHIWRGTKTRRGHPQMWFDGRATTVRRVLLALRRKSLQLPSDRYPALTCGNLLCVNPEHVRECSSSEYMRAANRRDPTVILRRMTNMRRKVAKLTPATAAQIRVSLSLGESVASVARKHGVDRKTIWMVREGRTWKQGTVPAWHP